MRRIEIENTMALLGQRYRSPTRAMRFSLRHILIATCVIAVALGAFAYHVRARQLAFLKRDPRLYYKKLVLVEPIVDSGFSYFLDGGSIVASLTDANGVTLYVSSSPPGGLFPGDTTGVYIGTKAEMWATRKEQMNGRSPWDLSKPTPPFGTRIKRGGDDARLIASYIESSISSPVEWGDGAVPQKLIDAVNHERSAMGNRLIAILTTSNPFTESWGPGSPSGEPFELADSP